MPTKPPQAALPKAPRLAGTSIPTDLTTGKVGHFYLTLLFTNFPYSSLKSILVEARGPTVLLSVARMVQMRPFVVRVMTHTGAPGRNGFLQCEVEG
ncbi:hypothetical protein V565_043950 [Rhizoctonia solani 123E]|uniref:Uncharacterized protein n=1 Tax=Rhizoctonia solani 123E TaxID=1423351 RepID=A0A074S6P2_9AGAM|nr:hypothetical protein V565_043950 [Rhizoctonia solani 123E]